MNAVIENLLTRRSIRKFKTDPIADADLDMIINAALYAPSTKGRQDSHILVVKGLDNIKELDAIMKKATIEGEPHQQAYKDRVTGPSYSINFNSAPVFVIVTADTKNDSNTDADGAVVLQNIFLAAHSLGVGSVWINQLCPLSDVPVMRAYLSKHGVPDSYRITGCAALGYNASEHPSAAPRKDGRVSIIS